MGGKKVEVHLDKIKFNLKEKTVNRIQELLEKFYCIDEYTTVTNPREGESFSLYEVTSIRDLLQLASDTGGGGGSIELRGFLTSKKKLYFASSGEVHDYLRKANSSHISKEDTRIFYSTWNTPTGKVVSKELNWPSKLIFQFYGGRELASTRNAKELQLVSQKYAKILTMILKAKSLVIGTLVGNESSRNSTIAFYAKYDGGRKVEEFFDEGIGAANRFFSMNT